MPPFLICNGQLDGWIIEPTFVAFGEGVLSIIGNVWISLHMLDCSCLAGCITCRGKLFFVMIVYIPVNYYLCIVIMCDRVQYLTMAL